MQIVFVFTGSSMKYKLPMIFHKLILIILGVKIKVRGSVSKKKPLILVGNHISYLDILILGSLYPICFIAKHEIKNWFFFGFLARMQNSIFIERKNARTLDSIKKIHNKVNENFAIVLFPEGTTGTGKSILNFKSSLFRIFETSNILRLQNFSLCYTHINSMPIDRRLMPSIAWYGNMNMVKHLKNLLSFSSINASVNFIPEQDITGLNRKAIAALSLEKVKKGFYFEFKE